MSQNDFVVADQTFPSILADFNAAFQALATLSAGAAAPGTTYAYQLWADTANNLLKMRNGANNAWLTLAKFDTVNDRWELRSDVLQALSASGLILRDSAGVALASFSGSQIYLNAADVTLRNAAGTAILAQFIAGGASYLRHNNTNRIWTTSTGVTVYGKLVLDTLGGAALDGGFTATSVSDGTKSSGTYTPSPSGGNMRHITNGGAFTLAAPSASGDYSMTVDITNNASAGAVTLSGFTKTGGDAFTTTNGHKFRLFIVKGNAGITCNVMALQ